MQLDLDKAAEASSSAHSSDALCATLLHNSSTSMASSAAVKYFANKAGSPILGFAQLQLRVKPGSSKNREGILIVTSTAVQLSVAAQPRQGAANQAVLKVLSHALGISISRMRIVSGLKSKDKIATIDHLSGSRHAFVDTILKLLQRASHATSPT